MQIDQRTEYRVHYRYGVNSGTLIGGNVKHMIERHEQQTMGPIGEYKVEERIVTTLTGEWFDITDSAL